MVVESSVVVPTVVRFCGGCTFSCSGGFSCSCILHWLFLRWWNQLSVVTSVAVDMVVYSSLVVSTVVDSVAASSYGCS